MPYRVKQNIKALCNISKKVPFLFMIIVLLTTCEIIYTYLSIYTNGIAWTVLKDKYFINIMDHLRPTIKYNCLQCQRKMPNKHLLTMTNLPLKRRKLDQKVASAWLAADALRSV